MRVAIIKMRYSPYGGNERYSYRIIEEFVRQGHEVHIITGPNEHWIEGEGVHHIYISYLKTNKILKLISFNKGVKKFIEHTLDKYDCILNLDSNVETGSHIRLGGGLHKVWVKKLTENMNRMEKLLISLDPFHKIKIRIQERALKSSLLRRVICNSEMILNELREHYPEVVPKAVVIHNGVGWKELSHHFEYGMRNREKILKDLNLHEDSFYFLFVGSGYRRKGLEFVIKAMKFLPKETRLLVIGKDSDERYYQELARSLQVQERIHFYGPQKEVIPFYQIAHAFVLPSLYDPCSNATLEALAMGLFTITSASNGASEVITDKSGMVVSNPTDVSELAECMKKAFYRYHAGIKGEIRETVRHLDFSFQLPKIVETCLGS